MSRRAEQLIAIQLKQKRDLLLCVSAGGTPTGAYERLAIRYDREPGLFKALRVLQIDEWAGLPDASPARCEADLRRKLLKPLHVSEERYVGFHSNAAQPQGECDRIARWLASNRPIDLCILGLGTNGHIAMNEPAAEFFPQAHVAKLARSSQSHPLLKDLRLKPRHGFTLGMGDILRSRKLLLLVSGKRKRAAFKRLMKPRVTTHFPASFVWLHQDATVLCDQEAAGDLNWSL
jgi:galactosamine-6-phosphate isomerase